MAVADQFELVNQFIMDNLLILLLGFTFIFLGVYAMKNDGRKKRRRKKGNRVAKARDYEGLWIFTILLGLGAIGIFLAAIIMLLFAGSIVVVGNWFVYGTEPSNSFEQFLVGYFGFLIILNFLGALLNN